MEGRQRQSIANTQFQQMIQIQPTNVIVFYRNQFQASSTIRITKNINFKKQIKFILKTTNKSYYFVANPSGIIKQNESLPKYINILINPDAPLQQCLDDRFKLVLSYQGKRIEKKFKVIIDYKKENKKNKQTDLTGVQISSKGSGSRTISTTTNSLVTSIPKNNQKLASYTSKTNTDNYSYQPDLKQELDSFLYTIQLKQRRLEYLQKQEMKGATKNRLVKYSIFFAILFMFLLGLLARYLLQQAFKQPQKQKSWWEYLL